MCVYLLLLYIYVYINVRVYEIIISLINIEIYEQLNKI